METHVILPNLKRAVIALLALSIAWLGFLFLEPVLTWSSGWQQLPTVDATESLPADAEFVDAEWRDLAKPATKRLFDARADLQTPALSAAISIKGKRVWAGVVGMADVASKRRATLDSSFRLGSTSKAVTSVAIGTALDAGLLDLEQPTQHYIADLAPPLATITTRQAISHTAGVRNYGLCLCFPIWEHQSPRHFANTRDASRVFESDPLLFTSGTGFAYSSFGYNVAGAVLEAAAKTSFLDYLQRSVFDPLAMKHSGGDHADAQIAERVTFYETQDGSNNPQGYALGWRYSAEKKLFDGTHVTRIIHHNGTAVELFVAKQQREQAG